MTVGKEGGSKSKHFSPPLGAQSHDTLPKLIILKASSSPASVASLTLVVVATSKETTDSKWDCLRANASS